MNWQRFIGFCVLIAGTSLPDPWHWGRFGSAYIGACMLVGGPIWPWITGRDG